jgi:hypothetical protein
LGKFLESGVPKRLDSAYVAGIRRCCRNLSEPTFV